MARPELVQPQDQQAGKNGYVRPLVSPHDDVPGMGRPFLAAEEIRAGAELRVLRKPGGHGTYGKDQDWRQSPSSETRLSASS